MLSIENNQNDTFRILFETAGEGHVVANKDGRIDIVNSRVEELFGYKRQELIGQKVEMLIPRKTSLWDRLFKISVTKKVALHADTPLLILQD